MIGIGIQLVKGDRKIEGKGGKFKVIIHSLSWLEFKMPLTGSCFKYFFSGWGVVLAGGGTFKRWVPLVEVTF